MQVPELVEGAVQLALHVLQVTNQVALHTPSPPNGALVKRGDVTRVLRCRRRLWRELAGLMLPMQFQPLLQRKFQALKVEVRRRRAHVAPAVAQVDLLVGVQHEKVQRVVAVVIEQPDVDPVHAGDACRHILLQQLAPLCVVLGQHHLCVKCPAGPSRGTAELEEDRLACLARLLDCFVVTLDPRHRILRERSFLLQSCCKNEQKSCTENPRSPRARRQTVTGKAIKH